MRVLNAEQIREADRCTIDDLGVPSTVLMENAGRQVVAAMRAVYGDIDQRCISVLCGCGNNGGDGLVVARVLWQQGVQVQVFLSGDEEGLSPDSRINLQIIKRTGIPLTEVPNANAWQGIREKALNADLIVDSLLGTGITRALEDPLKTVVADVNASDVPVLSVDIPTGLPTDQAGDVSDVVAADVTVTLAAPKPSLLLPPTDAWAGDLVIVDIGIPESVIDRVPGPRLSLLTPDDVRDLVPARPSDAHKGHFGHVLLVAGGAGKSGAAALAGRAALRSGAGLVTVAAPSSVIDIVAAATPECMTLSLPSIDDGTLSASALEPPLNFECDVVAAGPGLGSSSDITTIVKGLLSRKSSSLVLDADALNALASEPTSLVGGNRPVIITPHPGEMARLTARSTVEVQTDRLAVARQFAVDHRLHVVLKGAGTIVADPSGDAWLNLTGNPGMATAGVGDVLTGVIAAWLAQTSRPDLACQLGVYLHGLAGDLASDEQSEVALIASDVIDNLGVALVKTTNSDELDRDDVDLP